MLRKIVAVWIVALVSLSLAGCGSSEPAPEPAKTEAEYKAEAEKEITTENVEAELDKLEQEVNLDAAEQP
jgi:predicted small lipoprotein YifL